MSDKVLISLPDGDVGYTAAARFAFEDLELRFICFYIRSYLYFVFELFGLMT